MVVSHNLGFPRIGPHREMKKAVEAYWRNEISQQDLHAKALELQTNNWELQSKAGLHMIPVGDFTWYDHVLDHSFMFGVIPDRFKNANHKIDINTYFCMARGLAPGGQEAAACEMTKWFDTNYHYIVPEFSKDQTFEFFSKTLIETVTEAIKQGHQVKPVILGPLTFLWLGKCKDLAFDKLSLLDRLLPIYAEIFQALKEAGAQWIQIDEPILCFDLPNSWRLAFYTAYNWLNGYDIKCLLTTYFESLGRNLPLACQLPTDGLHIDLSHEHHQLDLILKTLPKDKVLSLGVVNGRNIWKADLNRILNQLEPIHDTLKDRLWLAPSCSLLHVPIDLNLETQLDPEIKNWLSFAKQKIDEIVILSQALNHSRQTVAAALDENKAAIENRTNSKRVHNQDVQSRLKDFNPSLAKRKSAYTNRSRLQKNALKLGLLPTTTIGSFPQTKEIRNIRRSYKNGNIDNALYEKQIRAQIADVIKIQESLGLDVLVHGEAERNDMVEYFGEQLAGNVFTMNGWVQSYGSRCVKPPIIYGDVYRLEPMTIKWSTYAQSLTSRKIKGMLTGPVTILAWSFVRDDQPQSKTALQIAFALRDEVIDLESAGIQVIQIDEPAFREKLPLRRADWTTYLDWAVTCFRVASCGVKDETQIHTHMCYSEFNDIIESIAALDADVITLESSRSDMELLQAFEQFNYPNDIGPGVYDIHSPRIPTVEEIEKLLGQALCHIPIERLWVNPDCGLKTRHWAEVKTTLTNMVHAAARLKDKHQTKITETVGS